jgi:transposase-like protein
MNQALACVQTRLMEMPARADGGSAELDRNGPSGELPTAAERQELLQLRQRVKSLERERDMLVEAIAFFAAQIEQSSDLWRRHRDALR